MSRRLLGKVVPLAVSVALLGACGGDPEVPQDDGFAACLDQAGLTAPAEDASAGEVEKVMGDPAALRCAAEELGAEDLRSLMRTAYDESDDGRLLEALREVVATSDTGAMKLAEETGTLVGSLDQESDEWQPSRYENLLAWEIQARTEQEPPGFAAWQAANPDRTGDDAIIFYVQELGNAPDGSPEYAAWRDIIDIAAEVRSARLETAEA